MFLILIILNISQAQIHMLQRTQSLLIFLPVPETSSDKSDIQRNYMWLTNQPISGEQRSSAKMTYLDIVTHHNQQCPGGLREQAWKARAGALPDGSQDSRVTQASFRCLLSRHESFYSWLPPPQSLQVALGKLLQLLKGFLGYRAAEPSNLAMVSALQLLEFRKKTWPLPPGTLTVS